MFMCICLKWIKNIPLKSSNFVSAHFWNYEIHGAVKSPIHEYYFFSNNNSIFLPNSDTEKHEEQASTGSSTSIPIIQVCW